MNRFEIKEDFILDGKPFKIISGSIHYFRVVPEYWRDRLLKLKAMGCNTVETYVPWNLHEPKKGQFCFEGILNLVGFLRTAQELGLFAIVRPSPFICAEWEFGGLPAWLLTEENIRLRSSEGAFLSHVEAYYIKLLPLLTPLQIDNGGPIILMQVENEFGAYGDDRRYLERMSEIMRENGATVPFITSDNLENDSLSRGGIADALTTINFGSQAAERLPLLLPYVKGGPLMCTEFWVGWFDHWGNGGHQTTAAADSAAELDEILRQGSVNFYMFHGGTSFGWMNGANDYDKLTPDVTSYDYDAPLSEDGQITPKYEAFRNVISKYAPIPEVEIPPIPRKCYGTLSCNGCISLFDALERLNPPVRRETPCCMETLGQSYGYIYYSTVLSCAVETLELTDTNDRVQIFVNDTARLTLYDREIPGQHALHADKNERLQLLCENLGRVNYGKKLKAQRKGINGKVTADGSPLAGWEIHTLALEADDIKRLVFFDGAPASAPAFHRFNFQISECADTFLDTTDWGKGCVFLNGFNLGRFWDIGPQKRLYIPAPLLKAGENELVIFETEGKYSKTVLLAAEPQLG